MLAGNGLHVAKGEKKAVGPDLIPRGLDGLRGQAAQVTFHTRRLCLCSLRIPRPSPSMSPFGPGEAIDATPPPSCLEKAHHTRQLARTPMARPWPIDRSLSIHVSRAPRLSFCASLSSHAATMHTHPISPYIYLHVLPSSSSTLLPPILHHLSLHLFPSCLGLLVFLSLCPQHHRRPILSLFGLTGNQMQRALHPYKTHCISPSRFRST